MENKRQGKRLVKIWLSDNEIELIEKMILNKAIIGMIIKKAIRRGDFEKC